MACVGFLGDGDQDSPAAQHRPGPGQDLSAHRVDHHIDITDLVFEPAGIVDDLASAEPGDEVAIPRGRRGGHPGAVRCCQLDRVGTDAAGPAVDQDVLPRLQVCVLMQRLPGRQRPQRERSRLDVPDGHGPRSRSAAGTVTYSAAAPGRSNPTRPYTFSPGCQPLTPRPAAATTPDTSWHGIAGQVSGQVSSPAVTAVAWTSTSSSPGAGSGTGTLWQVRLAGSGPAARIARIVGAGLVTGHLRLSPRPAGPPL